MDKTVRLAAGSIVVGLIVLALKYVAYLLTGSVALYSEALESIVNVATAVTIFLAVRFSAVPPDASHPFGHQKVEYLSAVLIGVLIVVAALSILREAYFAFLDHARGAGRRPRRQRACQRDQRRLVLRAVPFREGVAFAGAHRRRAASPDRRHHLCRRAHRRGAGRADRLARARSRHRGARRA